MIATTIDSHEANSPRGETGEKIAIATDTVGEEARPIDPQEARRVLWKIDLFLIPAMVIGTWSSPLLVVYAAGNADLTL